jgi:uncharacterized membrane protein
MKRKRGYLLLIMIPLVIAIVTMMFPAQHPVPKTVLSMGIGAILVFGGAAHGVWFAYVMFKWVGLNFKRTAALGYSLWVLGIILATFLTYVAAEILPVWYASYTGRYTDVLVLVEDTYKTSGGITLIVSILAALESFFMILLVGERSSANK